MKSRVDRWLSAGFIVAIAVEVFARPELRDHPPLIGLAVVFAIAISFRRQWPLGAVVACFTLATLSSVVQIWLGIPDQGPGTGACVLLLPYTLARWGTLRQVVIGSLFMLAAWGMALVHGEMKTAGDAVGAAVVMILPGTIGAIVRFRDEAQVKAIDQARLLEREQLARELHDSVAHHVSAITLQAQAARAVLSVRPDDAREALAAIEDESKRTLAELRAIVGALRSEEDAALAPARGISDLPSLARSGSKPEVRVELVGDLQGLAPAVERAVFRLAQESVTNALKHARNATKIELKVSGDAGGVRVTARDDGQTAGLPRNAGFGLIGMAERAALLKGTFEAGPGPEGGWRVVATIPRDGGT
ncbi:MAG: sensor histidine kinase [Archangium sp.]|nr:sensor histidine kinase [Archangium sp.]